MTPTGCHLYLNKVKTINYHLILNRLVLHKNMFIFLPFESRNPVLSQPTYLPDLFGSPIPHPFIPATKTVSVNGETNNMAV